MGRLECVGLAVCECGQYGSRVLPSGIRASPILWMPTTRMETQVDSVQEDVGVLKEIVQSHAHDLVVITEKLDLVLKGQAFIATELANRGFSPGHRGPPEAPPSSGSTQGSGNGGGQREGMEGQRSEFRARKIELPVYSGGDPDEWTYRADCYFGLQWLSTAVQLEAIVMCLERAALYWFHWETFWRSIDTWDDLKTLLIHRFRPVHEGSVFDHFLDLQQTSTVQEYRRQFEMIASAMGNVSDSLLESTFVKGLKMEIQGPLRILEPTGLVKTMELAKAIEANQTLTTPTTYRRLTEAEIKDQKARGVCFKCEGKWQRGHECKFPELQIILLQDEASDDDSDEDPIDESLGLPPPPTPKAKVVEVPLNSVVRLTSPKTMKLMGSIHGHEVVVLIDSGATHNFITSELASKLALPISTTESYGVQMGTGQAIRGEGICRGVPLILQELEILDDFLPLPLDSTYVILGIQWLETLDGTYHHWKDHVMKLNVNGKAITLHGDPSLHKTRVSLKTMMQLLQHERQGVWVELGSAVVTADSPPIPKSMMSIVQRFQSVFEVLKSLPPLRSHDHAIPLRVGSSPVSVRPYRYAQIQKAKIERLRFCVDYRTLNQETVADEYPIPVIDELLDELHRVKVFSKLDLRSGYHQIRVRATNVHKTVFRTHEGHYEFLVMPFGLTNAHATFQSLMNKVFKPYLHQFVLVFFYDNLVYSLDEATHEEHLTMVLHTLGDHQLYANLKKCCFGQRRLEYLGHIISGDRVTMDSSKVQAMIHWPLPTTLKELRGFLGLTGYYQKFIAGYGAIARPLTDQLKKEKFWWTEATTQAFNYLKQAMISVHVLALPDFSKTYVVETDALGFGIGVVLMQEGRPIAYYSQVLKPHAQLKSIYEKELMAIVLAILKWQPYLLGCRFFVRTDQQSLKFLLEQRLVTSDHHKWLVKLLGYDFKIQYRPGVGN
ncbi:uncharacterized protein LOC133799409 [Humulus lupulus]|uniref:uncharacterized protein LOC133799409 n=1 Tax=Humulus lupulus TaxID=3486 RepID=UPI002B40D5C8|nr:uncharacterized protein LOC133799409 [Humulus lupulus]